MPRRHVFVTVCCCLMALVALMGYTHAPEQEEKMPVRILLDNAGGRVVFDHQRHAADYKVACETCHHEILQAEQPVNRCGSCHGADFEGSFRDDHVAAFSGADNACVTCHHMASAPAKWDHTAHAEEYGLSCTDCHHADAGIEPEPSRCTACHLDKPAGPIPDMKTAAHAKCVACHQELFQPDMKGCTGCHPFVDTHKALEAGADVKTTPGDANCATCHEGAKPTDLIPDRMAAFHGQCMKCHERLGKGPFRKDQCNQCHTK